MFRVLGFAGVSLVAVCASLSVSAETLEEALAYSYQNNPTLLAQRAYVRAVDENVAQALSGWRPTIAAVGNFTPSSTKTSGSSKNPVYNSMYGDNEAKTTSYGVGLNVSQPIFSGFKTVSQTKAAENQVKAERANLRLVEENVLTAAATAYADVLKSQAILELKVNNEKLLKRELDRAYQRFEVGEITNTDVAQTEASYSGAVADRIMAEGDLQVAKANYLKAVGKNPENLSEPLAVKDLLPLSLDNAIELAASYNPAVIAAEYSARSAWYNVNNATGDLLPDLGITASVRKDWNNPLQNYDTETYKASANLTVPLYEAGAAYSKVRQAKHTANQYRILKEKAVQEAVNSVTSAWESLNASKASIASIKMQIDASERALTGVKNEELAGERTVLDVLNAEQALLNNRVSLVEAKRNELVASFYVMSAVGRMTASNLELDTKVYDPMQNYDDVSGKWFGTGINEDDLGNAGK